MYFASSIAKRTRSQEALYLRREYERMKRNRESSSVVSLSECSGSNTEKSHADEARARDSEELDSGKVRRSKNVPKGRNFVIPVNGNDEDELAVLRNRPNLKKPKDVIVIEDDDEDEDEEEIEIEKGKKGKGKLKKNRGKAVKERGFSSVSLNSSRFNSSVGEVESETPSDSGSLAGSRLKRSTGEGERRRGLHSGDLEDYTVEWGNAKKTGVPKAKNVVPVVLDENESSGEETEKEEESFKFNGKEKFFIPRSSPELGTHNQHNKPASVASSSETSSKSSSSDDSDDNSDDEDFRINEGQCSDSEEVESTSCSEDGGEDGNGDDTDDIEVEKRGSFVVEEDDVSFEERLKKRRECGPNINGYDIKVEERGSSDVDEEDFSVEKRLKRRRDCGTDRSGKDTDDIQVQKRGSFVVEDLTVKKRLKERGVCEPDILAPPKRDKGSSTSPTSYNCVASRTRSRFSSRFSQKNTTTRTQFGTNSRSGSTPVAAEQIDSSSESGSGDDSDDDLEVVGNKSNNDNADDHIKKEIGGKDERELWKPPKRKRVQALKTDSDDDHIEKEVGGKDKRELPPKRKRAQALKTDSDDHHIEKEVGGKDERELPPKRERIQALKTDSDDDHIEKEVSGKDEQELASKRKRTQAQKSDSDGDHIEKEVGGKDGRELASTRKRTQAQKSDSDADLEVVDDDDLEVVDDDDDDLEVVNEDDDEVNNDNADDHIQKAVDGKDEGELGKATKRKRVRALQCDSLFKLFVDTIWEKTEVLQQESTQSDDEAAEQTRNPGVAELPLKFSFGVEKPTLKEKSDYEKEMDQLWAEFDFALRSCELGSFTPATVDIKEDGEEEVEADPSTFCQSGKHHLILDEQIGIRCRFCSFVKLEIKYILPSFSTSSPGDRMSKRTASDDGDFSIFDAFPLHRKSGDVQGSNVPTTGTVWDKYPGLRKEMYPHQQEGFEFLWRNIAGGIDLDIKKNCSNDIGGCVISHAPGTGKTFLTIAFLRTYMEIYKECRPVIIAPCSMLLTWAEEFKKWKVNIPFHNLNSGDFSGKEDRQALKLVQNKPQRQNLNRIVKLVSWSRGNSILGVSYPLFEKLAGVRPVAAKEGQKGKKIGNQESEEIRKILLEKPSLLVLDEGHTPRNSRSCIYKALSKIKTERRIILSGTPFQNNFEELYNTLWLVRPKFADKNSCKTQGSRGRQSKVLESGGESRGKWASLTSSIGNKSADDRLLQVREMIGPFVHVHSGSILQKNLPGLRDCVVVLHPPPLQKQLLEEVQGIKNSFKQEHEVALVSVHPSLLEKCSLSGTEKVLIEKNHEITSDRFKLDPNEGVKTRFLMELLKLSEALNEKVLVFSQFLDPINLIKDQLKSLFNWTEGNEVLQMDGKQDPKVRQTLIKNLNDPDSKVKVLLASTKACREGISLIGASRIVLLDVLWNPSVERQAISRAYRLGQKKVVYTYHLITSGTMEGDKYCRQVQKDHLSKLVFSTEQGEKDQTNSTIIPDDRILDEMVGHEKLKDMFAKIIYQTKETDLIETFSSL